jgi:hypothetical protein
MLYLCAVKEKVRIAGSIILAAYYCLAIGVVAMPHAYSDVHKLSASSQEIFRAELPEYLFCHTSQTESSLKNVNAFPIQTLLYSSDGFLMPGRAAEQLADNTFSQYIHKTQGLIVNGRKSDLIFPFHYFW